jgi:hypothetical protein
VSWGERIPAGLAAASPRRSCVSRGSGAFLTSCSTHDGPFSGTLDGDQLHLRLRSDEDYEVTFDLTLRVVPGDSVLNGRVTLVELGSETLCFNDFAPITLHYGEVGGLPIGR